MGINQSLLSESQASELSNFEVLEPLDLGLYGNFLFVAQQNSESRFFYREFTVESLNPDIFNVRLQNPAPGLLKLSAGNLLENEEGHYEGFLLVEAFDLEENLASAIGERTQGMHYFKEEEIWHIIESSLSGLEFLISTGKAALCISSFQLYRQDGLYKLLDFEEFTDLLHNLDLTEPPLLYYQSPHLRAALEQQEPIDITEKDNVFSLGVCILETALLEHPLHQEEEGEDSFAGLEESLRTLKGRYSQNLIDFLRMMVALDENERPDVESLLIEIKRIEKLMETPKSFKQKDEFFGLGRSKINTGVSIPFSNDFRFSKESPLIEDKVPKNMMLGHTEPKAIMEENESQKLVENKQNDHDKSRQEIYYLSSEILPKSELFKSADSNPVRISHSQPVPTFADYRVSIQNKLEEPSNRPSTDPSNRPSHFRKESENIKQAGLGPNREATSQSHDDETIEFRSPEKVGQIKPPLAGYGEQKPPSHSKHQSYDSDQQQQRGYENQLLGSYEQQSKSLENQHRRGNSKDEQLSGKQESYVQMGSYAKEEQDKIGESLGKTAELVKNYSFFPSLPESKLVSENSNQMQFTSKFPESNVREAVPRGSDVLDKALLTQSFNYAVEKNMSDSKPMSRSYQISDDRPQVYSIYQPIEPQTYSIYKPIENQYVGGVKADNIEKKASEMINYSVYSNSNNNNNNRIEVETKSNNIYNNYQPKQTETNNNNEYPQQRLHEYSYSYSVSSVETQPKVNDIIKSIENIVKAAEPTPSQILESQYTTNDFVKPTENQSNPINYSVGYNLQSYYTNPPQYTHIEHLVKSTPDYPSTSNYNLYKPQENIENYNQYKLTDYPKPLENNTKPNEFFIKTDQIPPKTFEPTPYNPPHDPISQATNNYETPRYPNEQTHQLPLYQDLRGNASEYYDRPVSGNKFLMDSAGFETSQFLEKTPEKLAFDNRFLTVSDQKGLLGVGGSSNVKVVYSAERSALRMKQAEEDFQRKSQMIQENKKAVDRSLNILRDACNFLKERKPLV